MSSENTRACTTATNKPCICTMIGTTAGIFHGRKLIRAAPHPIAIARRSHPDHILPNNLPHSDMIFANCPMISNNPMKSDMIMSNILLIQSTTERGIFHSGKRYPLPRSGIYELIDFSAPLDLYSSKSKYQTVKIASAIVKLKSVVGVK